MIKKSILIFFGIIISLLVFIAGLVNSEFGSRWIIYKLIPNNLKIKQINGTLSHTIQFSGIHYSDAIFATKLDKLAITWQPAALLKAKIHVQQLQANNLLIKILKNKSNNSSSSLPANFLSAYTWLIEHVQIQHLSIITFESNYPITLQNITFSANYDQQHLAANLQWHNLLWIYNHEQYLLNTQSQLQLAGKPEQYTIKAAFEFKPQYGVKEQLLFSGSGNLQGLTLSNNQDNFLSGQLTTQTQLNFKPLQWTANIDAKNLNPGNYFKAWLGKLSIAIQASGQSIQSQTHYHINLTKFSGSLRDHPINAQLQADIAENNISVSKLLLESAGTFISASGSLTDHYNFNWKIQAANLDNLIPNVKGKIEAVGNLCGTRKQPHIIAKLRSENLAYLTHKLNLLNADADIDLQPHGNIAIKLIANDGKINKFAIKKLALTVTGTPEQHQIIAAAEADKNHANFSLLGKLNLNQFSWQGNLKQLQLVSAVLGGWKLAKPAELNIAKNVVSIKQFDWRSQQQSIFLQGYWQQSTAGQLLVKIKGLQLEKFTRLSKIKIHSTLDADINLQTDKHHSWKGGSKILLAAGWFEVPLREQIRRYDFLGSKLTGQLTANGLTSNLAVTAKAQQSLSAEIDLPKFPQVSAKQAIKGKIKVNIFELGFLAALIPELVDPQGKLVANINLNGTLKQPTFDGQVVLSNAKTRLPDLGIALKDINLKLISQATNKLILSGRAASGGGILTLNGQLNPLNDNASLKIAGTDFLAYHTPEYILYISPTLTITKRAKDFLLSGNIFIPKANLAPQKYRLDSVELGSDVQFVNEQDKSPLGIITDINLTLGKNVTLDYYGLTGSLSGQLQIQDTPKNPMTGLGELSLEGKYQAYGQTLLLKRGRLLFTGGDIENPGLDIQASKKVNVAAISNVGTDKLSNAAGLVAQGNQLIVGVNVDGNVKNRQVILFSKPAVLSQADILSYLILGQPAAQASKADAQLLYNAANAFNIGGNKISSLTEQIKTRFGLDEINIGSLNTTGPQTTTDSSRSSSLILGKALSKKLFLNYSIGLNQQVDNIIRLRYFLTPKWILQTETNTNDNAVDIFYTFDK